MSMAKNVWRCAVVLALVTALGLAYVADPSYAGADKKFGADVRKIADAIKKGDTASAEAMAQKTAKKAEELADIMHLFKPRAKGGLGVGPTAQAKSDGIEMRLRDIARDAPTNTKDLEQLGYDTAAI